MINTYYHDYYHTTTLCYVHLQILKINLFDTSIVYLSSSVFLHDVYRGRKHLSVNVPYLLIHNGHSGTMRTMSLKGKKTEKIYIVFNTIF